MTQPARRVGAATAAGLAGAGFGGPCLIGIRHLAETGKVWQFLGYPTYGDGPFDRIGITTTIPLLTGFLAVCAAELVLAVTIVRQSPRATNASTTLLPFELAYWAGFALPFGLVFGIGRFLLLRRPLDAAPRRPNQRRQQAARSASRRHWWTPLTFGLIPNGSLADDTGMAYIIERNHRFYVVAYDGIDTLTGRSADAGTQQAHRGSMPRPSPRRSTRQRRLRHIHRLDR